MLRSLTSVVCGLLICTAVPEHLKSKPPSKKLIGTKACSTSTRRVWIAPPRWPAI